MVLPSERPRPAADPTAGTKSVSIIMKTWNALPHVRLCARTLLNNSDGPFELIVIDNGSGPGVVSFLRGLAQEMARAPGGESGERRAGGREPAGGGAGPGDLVCLIDSDVLVPRGWLSRLVAEFERHPPSSCWPLWAITPAWPPLRAGGQRDGVVWGQTRPPSAVTTTPVPRVFPRVEHRRV